MKFSVHVLGKLFGGREVMTEAWKAVLDFCEPLKQVFKSQSSAMPVSTQLQAVIGKWNVHLKNHNGVEREKIMLQWTLFATQVMLGRTGDSLFLFLPKS